MTLFAGDGFDLDAYLRRIGFVGEATASSDALRQVVYRHPLAIPFENLDPLLGVPVRLDAASLQQKLVGQGRGGYCYEHNLLLGHALTALGFEVTGLAARVLWTNPPATVTPRTHMALLVTAEGRAQLVDAGFGGLTLTAPLRLEPDVEQPTPHEPCRVRAVEEGYVVEALLPGGWVALYRFELTPQLQPDYEVASWYVSTWPQSQFVTTLIAARVTPDRRYALRNADLAIHRREGGTERRRLRDAGEIRAALGELFGIALPSHPALAERLDRASRI